MKRPSGGADARGCAMAPAPADARLLAIAADHLKRIRARGT